MLIALALACAPGFRNGKPDNLYETTPQSRTYTELGHVRARSLAYGSRQRTFDTAMQKLVDKAEADGADGVVNAHADAGCNIWIVIGIPNCHAKADGIAVKWGELPATPAAEPAQADAAEPESAQ
jgi:hypothetical protein